MPEAFGSNGTDGYTIIRRGQQKRSEEEIRRCQRKRSEEGISGRGHKMSI